MIFKINNIFHLIQKPFCNFCEIVNPINRVTLTGMLSVGDWTWLNDIDQVEVFDQNQTRVLVLVQG